MEKNYKTSKEAFVSGSAGSTFAHVNLISAVALCSIALHGAVHSRLPVPKSFNLIWEWILLVLPLLLSMTVFAERPILLSLLIIAPTVVLLSLPPKSPNTPLPSRSELPRVPSPTHSINITSESSHPPPPPSTSRLSISPVPSLSVFRSHMMLMTCLAILAVDFPVFPRSLAKCETFGVSLMDLGVGSFVFSQGVVSALPILKDPTYLVAAVPPKLITAVKKVLPLLFLGVARVVSVKGTEYPEHESEYGTHWNFFFTLAVLPVLQIALHPLMIHIPVSLVGFLVALSHQLALSLTPLQSFTLHAPRLGLVSANKEGLVSLTGYLAIHLLGLSAGTVLLPPSPSEFRRQQQRLRQLLQRGQATSPPHTDDVDRHHIKTLQRQDAKTATELISYAMLWWTCLGLCVALNAGGGVSRRLANLPYVIWVAAFNTSFILCYLLLDMSSLLFRSEGHMKSSQDSAYSTSKHSSKAPPLLEAINLNGLLFFLLANIATGLINLSIKTMYSTDVVAILVLSAYAFGLCAVAWIFKNTRLWRL